MKIEIGESLCYSYLRHVQKCWLAQANWKVSEHWAKYQTDDDLERLFSEMRDIFDRDGSILKGTKDCRQFLRQAEIDVLGVGQDGSVHAMDVAFHEAGLNYRGGAAKRVLKKLLRTYLILKAYHPEGAKQNIYFLSPKVHRAVQHPLEENFDALQVEYPEVEWRLLTNQDFTERVLRPTLRAAGKVADTSELFMRSVKLLELGGLVDVWNWDPVGPPLYGIPNETPAPISAGVGESGQEPMRESTGSKPSQLQPLVRNLMQTLLEDYPDFLGEDELVNLLDRDYCQAALGLKTGGFSLIRQQEEGRIINGHGRYWNRVYGRRFFVTSQWWKDDHARNVASLLSWVERLIQQRAGNPGVAALEQHRATLQEYLARAGVS